MTAAATQYAANPVAAHKQVMDASAFMRQRRESQSYNKDVSDTTSALMGKMGIIPSWVGPMGYYFTNKLQVPIDDITWLAGYRKGLKEYNDDHDQAVAFADDTVENAQTSGIFSDRSAIERGTLAPNIRQTEFVRMWTTLISYMLAKGNIGFERTQRMVRDVKSQGLSGRSILTVSNFAADIALLFLVEGLLVALIRGQWPDGDDEEDDDVLTFAGKTARDTAFGTVPFVRQVSSVMKGYSGGGTPIDSVFNDLGKLMKQADQGELDAAAIKAANTLGGTLFHYPSGQTNKFIDAYWKEHVDGEETSPYEYIAGVKK